MIERMKRDAIRVAKGVAIRDAIRGAIRGAKGVAILTVLILVVFAGSLHPAQNSEPVVFAMCQPIVSQIKNIEVMYEKNIITPDKIKLIAVYHEDERTNYTPAREYVEKKNLTWVTFQTINGTVTPENLYKENSWTPQFKKIFNETSGIIFTGGADIPPVIYGEKNELLTEAVTPIRSHYEASFLFHLLGGSRNESVTPFLESRNKYTVLGICLGSQTMNIACGGTMVQDIPSEIYKFTSMEQVLAAGQDRIHSSRYIRLMNPLDKKPAPVFHRIKLKKKGKFVQEMHMSKKDTPLVLSSHHQAMEKIGANLEVIATSMDGKIVEALQHKKYENVLGVQFHPEVYKLYMKNYYYQEKPGSPVDFNLRDYLNENPPSMSFHKKIWMWFSDSLHE